MEGGGDGVGVDWLGHMRYVQEGGFGTVLVVGLG